MSQLKKMLSDYSARKEEALTESERQQKQISKEVEDAKRVVQSVIQPTLKKMAEEISNEGHQARATFATVAPDKISAGLEFSPSPARVLTMSRLTISLNENRLFEPEIEIATPQGFDRTFHPNVQIPIRKAPAEVTEGWVEQIVLAFVQSVLALN